MKLCCYIVVFMLFFGCKEEVVDTKTISKAILISIPDDGVVGNAIEFEFYVKGDGMPILKLENSFGSMFFQPKIKKSTAVFNIHKKYTEQSGIYTWKLFSNKKILLQNSFFLAPKDEDTREIEVYFGPRSIKAGGYDFSMLTILPADVYDNPLSDGTPIDIFQQMSNEKQEFQNQLTDGYTWIRLYSDDNAGRMLVSGIVNEIYSKELTSMIWASNSVDFTIDYSRVHKFADANQVITYTTSIIKDKYDNVVGDGTFVRFIVENQAGGRLQAIGTTIGGIATGKLLHPAAPDTWKATAFIYGESQSNTIEVSFESAIKDYNLSFSPDNRTITVGPILSFMEQLVPDGIVIDLEIYKDKTLMGTQQTNSRLGKGVFNLEKGFYPPGDYDIKVIVTGITKEFNLKLMPYEVE